MRPPQYYHIELLLVMVVKLISCWQDEFEYLLADKDRCLREQPDVVIWVQGRASNPARRSIIREILASDNAWPLHIKPLFFFMVGRSNSSAHQIHLEYEYELYKDIVQNDYIEHYENQTAKMMSAINFLADYCAQAKIAIRMDDDIIYHPGNMISQVVELINKHHGNSYYNNTDDYHHLVTYNPLLEAKRSRLSRTAIARKHLDKTVTRRTHGIKLNKGNTIVCHLLRNFEIIRQHMNRPYPVNDDVLPHETVYPDFCAGFFIAITMDLLPQFQSLFKVEPPFWIDDSYLGVMQKIIGTSVVNADKLIIFDPPPNLPLKRIINSGVGHSLMAVHLMQGENYRNQLTKGKFLSEILDADG